MATIEKRGYFWRVKVRRTGLPAQTQTFDNSWRSARLRALLHKRRAGLILR